MGIRDAHDRCPPNRGWLGRALHIKTDWIIDARLEGAIIAAENVVRDEVLMPLNWKGSGFEGASPRREARPAATTP